MTWSTGVVAAGLGVVLTSGLATVAVAGPIVSVPSHITHTVDVHITVDGDVEVHTPELGELKPGTLIPDHLRIDGIPQSVTVNVPVPVTVSGATEHDVTCHCTKP